MFASKRTKGTPGHSRLRLGFLALVCGPLLGLFLAIGFLVINDVNPLDVGYYFWTYVEIGFIAGILGGASIGLSSLFVQRAKPPVQNWDGES
jgi:hypothetical protein